MTISIDEAIRLLSKWQSGLRTTPMDDVDSAVKLGIEALKLVKDMRDFQYWGVPTLLPGETKE
jgi:hypothetical protein